MQPHPNCKMTDFKLLLNNPPQGAFIRGSNITGTIDIHSDRAHTDFQAIRISLCGYSDVYWTETHSTTDANGDSSSRTVTYHSHENYIDAFADVWSQQTTPDGIFPAGNYQYPFTIPLNAARLPSSFEGRDGRIRYDVEARILRSGILTPDTKAVARINVVDRVDPGAPSLQRPVALRMEKTVGCLCCESAPVLVTVSMPRTGYCIGEAISMEVEVENGSRSEVRSIIVALQQRVQFRAEGNISSSTRTIASTTSPAFRPHSTVVWKPDSVGIPGTSPTLDVQRCSNISITYYLVITAAISGVAINPTLQIPVFLGNVPVEQQRGQQELPLVFNQAQGGPPMGQGAPPPAGPTPLGLDHLATAQV